MQIVLLLGLCVSFSAGAVFLSQTWRSIHRSVARTAILIGIGTLLNCAATVVFEGVLKAGHPTFFYHTNAPGIVTVKLFGGACILASAFYALFLYFLEKKQKGAIQASLSGWFSRIFLISFLLAAFFEFFVFNYRHYELIGFDKPEKTYEGGQMHGFYFNRALWRYVTYPQGSTTFGLTLYVNWEKVRNVKFGFTDDDGIERVKLSYDDELFSYKTDIPDHIFNEKVPRSLHVPLHTIGKTYSLKMIFPDVTDGNSYYSFGALPWTINTVVPLEISITRFLISFLFSLILLCLFPGSRLYTLPLNLQNGYQTAAIVILLGCCAYCFVWTSLSSYSGSDASFSEQKARFTKNHLQYNALVEALMVPQYDLLEQPHKDLPQLNDPYDMSERNNHDFYYPWDTVFFNGRYYVYFGVVPAITVLLPYRVATGTFLELDYAILFFCLLGLIGFYGLYSRIISRWFPDISIGFFVSGFILLFSLLNLTWCLRRGQVYELAITSGFCFTVWAVFLTLAAFDWKAGSLLLQFGAGTAAGLAVGCRPTLILVSILIFITFFSLARNQGRAKRFINIGRAAAFMIPYVIIGLMLMKYNYERFGDVTEFGIRYQLTLANESVTRFRLGMTGTILSTLCYFFTPVTLNLDFPFIHLSHLNLPYNGFLIANSEMAGLFCFPIIWIIPLLPFLRKQIRARGKTLYLFCNSLLGVGLLLCLSCALFSVTYRYFVDFAWLFGIAAIIGFFCLNDLFKTHGLEHWVQGAGCVAMIIGFALLFAITVTGEGNWFQEINPQLFEKLRYAVSFWL